MNIELLKKVYDAAKASYEGYNPAEGISFNMSDWISSPALADGDLLSIGEIREGSCGTAACIAGYVALYTADPSWLTSGSALCDSAGEYINDIDHFAQEQLGIRHDMADVLFYCENDTALRRLSYLLKHPDATAYNVREACPE